MVGWLCVARLCTCANVQQVIIIRTEVVIHRCVILLMNNIICEEDYIICEGSENKWSANTVAQEHETCKTLSL